MKTKQPIPEFYDFDSRGYLATFHASAVLFDEVIENKEYRHKRLIYDNLTNGKYDGYDFPIEFRQDKDYGSKMRDILHTEDSSAYLISDRFRDLLEENNVTGWKTYPIRLYDKNGNIVQGYSGLSFIGKGGYYNFNYWDGSDILMVQWNVLITERVAEIIRNNNIDDAELRKFDDYDDILGIKRYIQENQPLKTTDIIPEFYSFKSKNCPTTFHASAVLFREAMENKEYQRKRNIFRNMIDGEYDRYEFPIEFRQDKDFGNRMRDVLDTGWPPAYLISDRFRDLLTDNNVTGWKTYPITLYDKKGNIVQGYSGLSFTGRGGDFDKWPVDKDWRIGGVETKGVYNINNWDGSDIFMIRGAVLVTDRVAKLIRKNKIDAIDLKKLTDRYDIIGTEEYIRKNNL